MKIILQYKQKKTKYKIDETTIDYFLSNIEKM